MFCALILSQVTGCAAPNVSARAATSLSHLQEQDEHLASASTHLQEAQRRLADESDPRHAATEVNAGFTQVQQAQGNARRLHEDVDDLSSAAASLQHQIDSHRNDLLGPRGRRIRNRVILLVALMSLGWGLLQLGPIFGGPIGGGIIVAGHLLTAFARPLLGAVWSGVLMLLSGIIALWNKAIAGLGQLGGPPQAAAVAPNAAPAPLKIS